MDHEYQCACADLRGTTCRPLDGKKGWRSHCQHFQCLTTSGVTGLRVVGASEAALEALTRYLAVELADKNAVSLGVANTEAIQNFDAIQGEKVIESVVARTPAVRLVAPQDIAKVVAFLFSPAACMIRGQVILIDGGYTLLG